VDVEAGAKASEALVVSVGGPGEAEFLGIEALLPLVERRRGGESGVISVRALVGPEVARAAKEGLWSEKLLGAALSRSDTPQGDALQDGRTQDLVGLGLWQGLARDPAAYLVEHRDGLRSAVLILNGVVADINFAVQLEGETVSAQLYRPPPPNSHHWSCLALRVSEFFDGGPAPLAHRGVRARGRPPRRVQEGPRAPGGEGRHAGALRPRL
jgi:hypothetical protein